LVGHEQDCDHDLPDPGGLSGVSDLPLKATPPRRIAFIIDTGVTWPFWEEDDGGLRELEPAELGLSDELTAGIHAWVGFWRDHSDGLLNWDSPARGEQFLERGAALVERIQAGLGPEWEVLPVPGITAPGEPRFTPPAPRDPARPRTGHWGLASPRVPDDPEEIRRRPA
jgi:hypothetical protein